MNVYLPIEFKERELGPKIFLSYKLSKNFSYNYFIGNYDLLIRDVLTGKLPPGIIIFKSIQRYLFPKLLVLRLLGCKFIHLEEESWVPFDSKDLLLRRYPIRNILLMSKIWMPIEIDLRFDKIRSKFRNKFHFTGHPRIDYFTKLNSNCFDGNSSFSNSILIISSFAYINNIDQYNFWKSTRDELGIFNSVFYKPKYKSIYNEITRDYEFMLMFISHLIKENIRIDYRPHPSENSEVIKRIAPSLNITQRDNFREISNNNYRHIVHFGSTFALDLIKNGFKNVVCLDRKTFPSILSNSKLSSVYVNEFNFVKRNFNSTVTCLPSIDYLFSPFTFSEIGVTLKRRPKWLLKSLYFILKKIDYKVSHYKSNINFDDINTVTSSLKLNCKIYPSDSMIFLIKYD